MEKDYQPSDIEREAIRLVEEERVAWESSVSFVTDKVAFNMKNLIRQCRKNWWGIFDQPIDPQTGQKLIWVPLTESVGETVVKNTIIDTKDVTFRAKVNKAVKFTSLVRSIVRNYLDDMDFGEKLKESGIIKARDGTAVWKTLETKNILTGKLQTDVRIVDLLNVYIDPTSPSIQEAYRFTERGIFYPDEIKQMKGWMNVDNLKASIGLPRNDGFMAGRANTLGTTKALDVWESYGKYPLYLITGKQEDKKIETDIKIILSGLETGSPRVHVIKKYSGLKPYEEDWYTKVPGRWYGKGVPEKLMMLQLWINTIVNIRINRSRLSQMGIFTIRRGSGITPQMISRLPSNGAITVNSQEDLQQLVMQEAGPTSYKDEDSAESWAQKVTSAYEVVTGEQLPSDTSATATALQSRSASSQFVLVKENTGLFLQRWLKRHAMPTMFKNLIKGDFIRMSLDDDELQAWDEQLVNDAIAKKLDEFKENSVFVQPAHILMEKQRLMEEMQKSGKERFTELRDELSFAHYETAVDITNESVDKGLISSNLTMALQAAPEYRDQILPQLFDTMGLTYTAPKTPPVPMNPNGQPAGQGAQPSPMAPPSQNAPLAMGKANTLANFGTYGQ